MGRATGKPLTLLRRILDFRPRAMSDVPPPPPDLSAPVPPEPLTPGSGLPPPTAAGLASLFSLPGGVIFYWLDRKDPLVLFYSVQAILLGGILFFASFCYRMAAFVFGAVPYLGEVVMWAVNFVWMIFILLWLTVWGVSTVCAFFGKRWQLPFLAPVIRRLTSRQL